MKDKLKIIIVIVALVLVGIISVVFNIYSLKPKTDTQTKEEIEKENTLNEQLDELDGLTEEEKEEMDKEEKESIIYGEEYGEHSNKITLGKNSNKEYSEEQSRALYKELISLSEIAGYPDIVNRVETLLNQYKFTANHNTKICKVYLDAKIMIGIKENEDLNYKDRGQMLLSMKDPHMLLTGTLMLNERERREIITEMGSLSPIFKGQVDVTETKIYTNENISENKQAEIIYTNANSIKELYEIKFKVENNPLIGYIVKYANGSLSFHSIIADGEYTHPYKPITYWVGLDHILYPKG